MAYCKNCGNEINENAAICVKCGCSKGNGSSYCPNCGQATMEGAAACTHCGVSLHTHPAGEQKSKLVAGLLAIFLGGLGIHNFYLGNTSKAVAQLCISLFGSCLIIGPAVTGVWALIEAIQIFTGKISTDAKGVPLKD